MQKSIFKPITLILLTIAVAALASLFIFRGVLSQSLAILGNSEGIEEYEVYSALLNEMFVEDGAKLLVIQKETLFYANPDYLKQTTTEGRILDMKKYYPSVSEETLRDYEAKFMQSSILKSNFNLPAKHVLINEAELMKDKDGSRVNSFYEKFQDASGMITLSKVGFNKNRTEAFVKVEFVFCPLCSHGDKILLEKKFGKWRIKENFGGWAS